MINGDKISVGPPYYALTFAPLAIPLLFLVVFGPMLNWKRDELRKTAARLKVPAIIAGVVLVAALPFGGLKGVMTAGALALSAWLLVGSATILGRRRSSRNRARPKICRAVSFSLTTITVIKVAQIGIVNPRMAARPDAI